MNNPVQNPTITTMFQPLSATPPAAGPEDASGQGATYVSPDELMVYCQARLQGLDSQIQAAFQREQDNNAASQAIDSLNAVFNCDVGAGFDMKTGHAGQDLLGSIQTQINQLPKGSPAAQALISLRDQIAGRMDPTGKLAATLDSPDAYNQYWARVAPGGDLAGKTDADVIQALGGAVIANQVDGATDVKGWMQELSNIQSTINQGSELQMIKLQSLMSQRQTAIQLTTNLVQSLGDQLNKIVANIGH